MAPRKRPGTPPLARAGVVWVPGGGPENPGWRPTPGTPPLARAGVVRAAGTTPSCSTASDPSHTRSRGAARPRTEHAITVEAARNQLLQHGRPEPGSSTDPQPLAAVGSRFRSVKRKLSARTRLRSEGAPTSRSRSRSVEPGPELEQSTLRTSAATRRAARSPPGLGR